ncbi:xylulokinase [Bifidobacterium tibiigranuli]|jgi:xylulokinase|uniref:xylulokinase n=1 Tax=Bifidobacterium tibiigranuli TaxID=2172043 RepID=UPI0026E9CFE5|nr:FGGY family carbohydrate kinase [Bifidobacterium tibiigranuli]MCI1650134.1 FGGY family carbohydrate kinase [Bifidobacterium tibiigranuli]MCI2185489.1 FGGY family carbohydrate kinase [Bifidobacterium tibiigranuli]MCI2203536.1 FGGY family carbohydrate kinase [Bifidobacterium tibiigranuli]
MSYVATFDAGTTAVKAALTDDDGGIVASCSSDAMPLFIGDGHQEQDPRDWWRAFLQAAHTMLAKAAQSVPEFDPASILGIIMSGQMQDVIALDEQLNPVRRAMLYSDGRADREARELAEIVGDTAFHKLTGNQLEGSLPLLKLMWFKRHEPQNFAKTRHVLFDAKDYLIARLTGALVADVVASSTVGAMDIRQRAWSSSLIDAAGMDEALFPALHNPEDRVGEVTSQAAELTGFAPGTPVFAGIGDAGATTLASGVTKPGEYNINIGTSGWIATVSPEPITDRAGVANLACTTAGGTRNGVSSSVINGVPFLNAGNVHHWVTSVFAGNGGDEDRDCEDTSSVVDYDRMSEMLARSTPGSNGVLCLPYLSGERFPVMNASIRGAYVGLSADTSAADMARAALEGVAFSIRQGLETFDAAPSEITLIGGGAREHVWCQIMADVLGRPIEVFRNADVMPAAALSFLVHYALGRFASLDEVTARLRTCRDSVTYEPDGETVRLYDVVYSRYRALYPAINGLG